MLAACCRLQHKACLCVSPLTAACAWCEGLPGSWSPLTVPPSALPGLYVSPDQPMKSSSLRAACAPHVGAATSRQTAKTRRCRIAGQQQVGVRIVRAAAADQFGWLVGLAGAGIRGCRSWMRMCLRVALQAPAACFKLEVVVQLPDFSNGRSLLSEQTGSSSSAWDVLCVFMVVELSREMELVLFWWLGSIRRGVVYCS